MSFEFNSFRPRKYLRSRFLDGDYLLSQEASDLELELLEYARTIVHNMLGDIALNDAWLTQLVPSSLGIPNYQKKLILRPGIAYYNGLLYRMESGLDPKVSASANQPATLGSPNDPGGKIVDFTGLSAGYYKLIVQAKEEQVTALQDTFLQGAAVPETTEQKRRVIYSIVPIPCDANGNISGLDPLNFANTSSLTTQQQTNFFSYNDLFEIPVTANSVVPTTDTLGSTAVVTFSNDNGGGTIFPTGPLIPQIFTGGFLVDPDGTYFYITYAQVSTSPDQVSFTISQELAVPAGTGLQPNPNLSTLGLKYSLIPADVTYANVSTGIPTGTKNYPVSVVYWNGTDFASSPFGITSSEGVIQYNIQDLRSSATQETIQQVANKENWVLTGGGTVQWNLSLQTLYWSSAFIIEEPTDPTYSFVINPGDTNSLFGSIFAEDEVLYFVIPPDASGATTVTLQKDARGTNDLARYQPEDIVILAYRKNNQIYSTHSGLTLVSPAYDERIQYPSGLLANTPITLPLNSRNNNLAENYDPVNGNLQVYVNQLYKYQNVATPSDGDWYSPGGSSTQIAFNYDLPANAEVHFRIESVNGWSTGTGGGSSGSVPKVTLFDTVDTTLPSSVPTTIDGVTVSNGDLVAFNTLSSGNNEVYAATITGGGPSSNLPNPIVLQVGSSPNPYAGGNLESVTSGVATPISSSSAYFEIDGTAVSGGTPAVAGSYSNTGAFHLLSGASYWVDQPFTASSTGSLGSATVRIGWYSTTVGSGLLNLSIYADNGSGMPTGSPIGTAQLDTSTLAIVPATGQEPSPVTVSFSSGSLTSGTNYHLVVDPTNVTFPSLNSLFLMIENLLATNGSLSTSTNSGASWSVLAGFNVNFIITTNSSLLASNVSGCTTSDATIINNSLNVAAQPFTPTTSLTANGILFTMAQGSGLGGTFTVGIYNDNLGQPGTLISDATVNISSIPTISSTLTNYILISGISAPLVSGTQYWVLWNFANITGLGSPGVIYLGSGACAATQPPEFSLSTDGGSTYPAVSSRTTVYAVLAGLGGGPVVIAENLSINSTDSETTNTTSLGQTFTATNTAYLNDAKLQLSIPSALPPNSGNLVVKIYTNNLGQPGTLLETSSTLNSASLTTTPTVYTFTFSGATTLTNGSIYHAILDTSGLTGTTSPSSISWLAQPIFNNTYIPTAGDLLVVTQGTLYGSKLIEFNGTTWAPISGGGGTQSLQSAYGYGNTITTTSGSPFTVGGVATKVAQFNGDIGVTGIIDPIALELSPQSSNPLSGSTPGIYCDTSGNLISYNGSTTLNINQSITEAGVSSLNSLVGALTLVAGANISITPSGSNITIASSGGSGTDFTINLLNMTGSTIPAYSAVYLSATGQITPANCTNSPPAASRVIGITTAAITNGNSGPVIYGGYIAGALTGLGISTGDYVYLSSSPGVLTSTAPSTPGYETVILGVANGNDLFLQIQNIGTV